MKVNLKKTISNKEIKSLIDNYISILVTLEKHKISHEDFGGISLADKAQFFTAKTQIEKFLGGALFLLKLDKKENHKWVDYSNKLLIDKITLSEEELTKQKICVYNGSLTEYGRKRARLCEGGHRGCSGPVKPCKMNIDSFKHISEEAGHYTAPRCKNCWDNSNGEFDEQ